MAKMTVANGKICHEGKAILKEDGKPLSINQATMMRWPKFCATWPADKTLIPGVLRLVNERAIRAAHEEKGI